MSKRERLSPRVPNALFVQPLTLLLRKADLQAELDRLSERLGAKKTGDNDSASSIPLIPLSPDASISTNAQQRPSPAGGLQQTSSRASVPVTNPDIGHFHPGVPTGLTPTSPKTLEDLEFGGAQIDDCFCL